jgi:hypothetical protein
MCTNKFGLKQAHVGLAHNLRLLNMPISGKCAHKTMRGTYNLNVVTEPYMQSFRSPEIDSFNVCTGDRPWNDLTAYDFSPWAPPLGSANPRIQGPHPKGYAQGLRPRATLKSYPQELRPRATPKGDPKS